MMTWAQPLMARITIYKAKYYLPDLIQTGNIPGSCLDSYAFGSLCCGHWSISLIFSGVHGTGATVFINSIQAMPRQNCWYWSLQCQTYSLNIRKCVMNNTIWFHLKNNKKLWVLWYKVMIISKLHQYFPQKANGEITNQILNFEYLWLMSSGIICWCQE